MILDSEFVFKEATKLFGPEPDIPFSVSDLLKANVQPLAGG